MRRWRWRRPPDTVRWARSWRPRVSSPPWGCGSVMTDHELWVVIPFFNEAGWITATLEALAAQTDQDFHLLLVDNASTDASRAAVDAYRERRSELAIEAIAQPEKGTGAGADTGLRSATAHGPRLIARPDADCRAGSER